jgi:catechol 2,3-dioxygenase-like lactoylglutathione lyase family enzyme
MSIIVRHHHVSIAVRDLDAQESWYSRVLGFTEPIERVAIPDPAVRTVILQAANGLRVELIERPQVEPRSFPDPLTAAGVQGYGHWAVQVGDLDAAFSELTAAGATVVWPPADAVQAGDRYAYIHDPEGNLLELIQTGPRTA